MFRQPRSPEVSHRLYLIKLVLALLRVVDRGLVSIVKQMTCSDKSITPIIARPACHQYSLALVQRLKLEDLYMLVRVAE